MHEAVQQEDSQQPWTVFVFGLKGLFLSRLRSRNRFKDNGLGLIKGFWVSGCRFQGLGLGEGPKGV